MNTSSKAVVQQFLNFAEGIVLQIEAMMSLFENSLRSSKEVRPLQLLHYDWYSHDHINRRSELAVRAKSFGSCVCLLALWLARFPFRLPDILWSELNISELYDNVVNLWSTVPNRSRPKQKVASNQRTRLRKPPGGNLLRIVDFLFSKRTLSLTFTPLVTDWRIEYFEALQEGRVWKARWISFRYYWAFAKACGLSRVGEVLGRIAVLHK